MNLQGHIYKQMQSLWINLAKTVFYVVKHI